MIKRSEIKKVEVISKYQNKKTSEKTKFECLPAPEGPIRKWDIQMLLSSAIPKYRWWDWCTMPSIQCPVYHWAVHAIKDHIDIWYQSRIPLYQLQQTPNSKQHSALHTCIKQIDIDLVIFYHHSKGSMLTYRIFYQGKRYASLAPRCKVSVYRGKERGAFARQRICREGM